MDTITALKSRKTIRGFTSQNISRDIMLEILTDAHWAPSSSNQQPWHFYAVTGAALADLCGRIAEAQKERKLTYDPSRGATIPQEYVARTRRLFKELRPYLSELGGDNRSFIESGSYAFYGAPVVVFMGLHTSMPGTRHMDIGMAAQNCMLSAHARGLGTCAIALTLQYADVICEALGIPADYNPALSIALGYPDENCPVNRFRAGREDIANSITWCGW